MLGQYIFYDNETLRYIEHALHKLENTKISFEHHRPINSKLCLTIVNYPKFHVMSHFVQCIWDYCSAVNNDTAHSKVMYKYPFIAFYNKTKKKDYNLQI